MDQEKVATTEDPKTSWNKQEVLALMAATANHVRTNGYGFCSVSSHLARVLFEKWYPNALQPREAQQIIEEPITEFDIEKFWQKHKINIHGVMGDEYIDREDFETAITILRLEFVQSKNPANEK